jgi:hypothetical protein
MSEEATAAPASAESTPAPAFTEVTARADAPQAVNSVQAAAKILRAARKQPQTEQAEAAAPPDEVSAPADDSSPVDDAARLDDGPGATETEDPAPQEPSIEPPRSWTKEEKEAFKALPREYQQTVAEREKARETNFLRSQNEVAEQRKAIEAEREQTARARQQYEAALPSLLQQLHHNAEFADIQTQADVERMVNEDWPRYVKWDFHQKKIAAVQQELNAAQARQQKEHQTDWEAFAKREDELFLQKAPEMQDATKRAKTVEAAVNLLKDRGYSEAEIAELWSSKLGRSHKFQTILLDAVRFQDAKKSILEAPKKQLPPVQRPGVSQGNRGEATLRDLETKLDRSSGTLNQLRAGAKLIAAMRAKQR